MEQTKSRNMEKKVTAHLDQLMERYPALAEQKGNIYKAYEIMAGTYQGSGKLLIAGNGGSAADAEHIVGELMKGFVRQRGLSKQMLLKLKQADGQNGQAIGQRLQEALPAIAVTGHVALSTAYLNDVDPLLAMAQQVYGYGKEGDTFMAISTSGNSQNILYACTVARAKGMKIVGLTGRDGGTLKDMSDVAIVVPKQETFQIQELHLPVYHALCLMLEEKFFG